MTKSSETTDKKITSRSALATYAQCARKYYYSYAYKGIGLSPTSTSLEMLIGSCLHAGVAALLLKELLKDAQKSAIDLLQESSYFNEERENGLLQRGSHANHSKHTQLETEMYLNCALAQFEKYILPDFLEEFEPVIVETPIRTEFTNHTDLEIIPDAILFNKYHNCFHALSIKSITNLPASTTKYEEQLQAHTERLGVVQFIQNYADKVYSEETFPFSIPKQLPDWEKFLRAQFNQHWKTHFSEKTLPNFDIKYVPWLQDIQTVYLFIARGALRVIGINPFKTRITPYTHCYKNVRTDEIKLKYEYIDDEGHVRRLGKDWKGFSPHEEFTVNDWLNALEQFGERGQSIFSWNVTTSISISQSISIVDDAKDLQKNIDKFLKLKTYNETHFPRTGIMNNTCTQFGDQCEFYNTCHKNTSIDSAIRRGTITSRISHHPNELKQQLAEIKWVEPSVQDWATTNFRDTIMQTLAAIPPTQTIFNTPSGWGSIYEPTIENVGERLDTLIEEGEENE